MNTMLPNEMVMLNKIEMFYDLVLSFEGLFFILILKISD